jgi:hypothetical protein
MDVFSGSPIPTFIRHFRILSSHICVGMSNALDYPIKNSYLFLFSFVLHAPPIIFFFIWSYWQILLKSRTPREAPHYAVSCLLLLFPPRWPRCALCNVIRSSTFRVSVLLSTELRPHTRGAWSELEEVRVLYREMSHDSGSAIPVKIEQPRM